MADISPPNWRGFNLITMIENQELPPTQIRQDIVPEEHFQWLAEWGFNFARVCLNYRFWAPGEELFATDPRKLDEIDKMVEFGRKNGIHVSLDIHQGPGKWEQPVRAKPLNLWKDQVAVDSFAYHLGVLAKRYKGIPSTELSLDLLNEPERDGGPEGLTLAWYEKWVRACVGAIRAGDPQRRIVAEGPRWSRDYVPSLADLELTWAFHCYDPISLTHYRSSLASADKNWPLPTWPMRPPADGKWPLNEDYFETYDLPGLKKHIQRWLDLADRQLPIHLGEFGIHHNVPHAVGMAWMNDLLSLTRPHKIGFAYWGVDGYFGVIDSRRTDAKMVDFHGHKLDIKLLTALQNA